MLINFAHKNIVKSKLFGAEHISNKFVMTQIWVTSIHFCVAFFCTYTSAFKVQLVNQICIAILSLMKCQQDIDFLKFPIALHLPQKSEHSTNTFIINIQCSRNERNQQSWSFAWLVFKDIWITSLDEWPKLSYNITILEIHIWTFTLRTRYWINVVVRSNN